MKKTGLSFIIVGILFLVFSIVGIVMPDKDYYITKGTIVNIKDDYDPIDDNTYYTTYIDYKVGGKYYKNVEYGAYDSSYEIGDQVTVYYDPANPELIQAEGYKKVPYIVGGVSIIIILFGTYISIKY